MINKNFIALIAVLSIASSCSSNKKAIEANSASEPKIISKTESVDEITMFSVTAETIRKSGTEPHVIYFDTNSYGLTTDALSTLEQKVLSEAKADNTKRVVIEAHSDERGAKAYNQKLSEKRAHAVKDYLVKNGVKGVKIKTIGYGKSKPVALGHDEASWSKNRRAVTISIKR